MTQHTAKTALVTGASRGIGKAIALRLAADGYAIVVNYAGNHELAQETVADITRNGGNAVAIQGDVTEPTAVTTLFDGAYDAFGSLDVVVHSAGIMALVPIKEDSLDAFDRTIATNLRGAFLILSQAAARLQEGGRIIALSSSVIGKSFPNYGPYIASKAGVEGLVRVLANELRGRSITVNAVAPGPTETELFMQGKSDEMVAQLAQAAPLERIGQPDEIASAVAFLAGPDGAWVNGQVLRVNGGMV
ncbi:SDR family oxidoreductase [Pseudomonas matsuisoli]|uniref:3-ketoacyl-ACP reductase n=1 Tax=Pseudomonas matsuisoli TaxID=1515666 RepID=A0A917UTC4_9PSED|nr:SDR family oxidoreductase [Pseudomonas matsuisoli]GGJ83930.1 3-ketoacyl-ACP reductase [Pseudomonas matsuisoli]